MDPVPSWQLTIYCFLPLVTVSLYCLLCSRFTKHCTRCERTFCFLSLYLMASKLLFPYTPNTSICMCMQYDMIHWETGRWYVEPRSVTVCACHVQWYTQRGTQRPHTDIYSQLLGVQCLLVQPVLAFPSFSLAILRTWPLKDISDANILINVYYKWRWWG